MIGGLYVITVCTIVMSSIYPVLTVCQVCALYVLSHLFFTNLYKVCPIITISVFEMSKVRLSEVNFLSFKDLYVSVRTRI